MDPASLLKAALLTLGAQLVGGRPAGVAACLSFGFPPHKVLWLNIAVEIFIVAAGIFLFVYSYRHLQRIRFVRLWTRRMERRTRRHRDFIARYGWAGLFVFTIIPLPVTGPLPAFVTAHVAGIRKIRVITAILCGTCASIAAWTYLFNFLKAYLNILQIVIVFIILTVLIYRLAGARKWFREEKE